MVSPEIGSNHRTGAGNPFTSFPFQALKRALYAACEPFFSPCSPRGSGTISFAPATWLQAANTPGEGQVVSINPTPTKRGHFTRDAKLTTSKYRAVCRTLASSFPLVA